MSRTEFLQGNQALVEGALLAGIKFFAGYPITPSTEIAELLSEKLPLIDGRFIQMEDEISAMGACIGASLTGLKAMTASSGPGISLKQENLGYACLCEIPVVIVNVMRGGPSTGLPTQVSQSDIMQARWGTHGDHSIIVVVPDSVQETLDLTIKAFNLSEKLRIPVIILSDEVIGHMREKVIIPDQKDVEVWDRKKPTCSPEKYIPFQSDDDGVPPMADFGKGYKYNVTGLIHEKHGFPTTDAAETKELLDRLEKKLDTYRDIIVDIEYTGDLNGDIGFISYGSSSRTVKKVIQELGKKGIKSANMRIKTVWPLPDKEIYEFSQKFKRVYVVELNMGQYVMAVKSVSDNPQKIKSITRYDGEFITPKEIIEEVLKDEQ